MTYHDLLPPAMIYKVVNKEEVTYLTSQKDSLLPLKQTACKFYHYHRSRPSLRLCSIRLGTLVCNRRAHLKVKSVNLASLLVTNTQT